MSHVPYIQLKFSKSAFRINFGASGVSNDHFLPVILYTLLSFFILLIYSNSIKTYMSCNRIFVSLFVSPTSLFFTEASKCHENNAKREIQRNAIRKDAVS